MKKVSIIVPTYNEKENIPKLLNRIFSTFRKNKINGEVIIVDDNSPDGTGLLAKKLMKKYKNLKVLQRKEKMGLSSAILDGLKITNGKILGVMDADLSHPPETIPLMLNVIKKENADFVIGSRYVKGGKIKGWDFYRKTVSKVGTLLSKIFTNVKDPMSGFFLIKNKCIKGIQFNPTGFKICLEFIVKANYNKIIEVPFTFIERKKGKTKIGFKEYYNYLHHLFNLFCYKKPNLSQLIKFCIVGGIGTIINLGILYILVEFFNVWYIFSAIFAFIISLTNNFILNKFWTFKNYLKQKFILTIQYLKFFIVSVFALGINLIFLYIFVEYFHLWYIFSQFLSIVIAMLINFVGNKFWIFKNKGLE